MDFVINILMFATLLSTFRVIIGPTVWDRLLGLSLISSKIIIIIIIYSLQNGQSFYLDVGLVFAILGFVGTTSLSKFLQNDK